VSQQFLLHLDISAGAAQHCRIGVSKGVPANLSDARTQCSRFQLPFSATVPLLYWASSSGAIIGPTWESMPASSSSNTC